MPGHIGDHHVIMLRFQVAEEASRRLGYMFVHDSSGKRAVLRIC